MVSDLLQDSRTGTLYAISNGVFRSRNGGDTWESASAGLKNSTILTLLQDSRDGTLYAGTEYGIYRSRDGGDTWQANATLMFVPLIATILQDSRDGTLYAGTENGIYRSRDWGNTWEDASTGLPEGTGVAILLRDSRDGTLYAGTANRIYRSWDGGDTWEVAGTVLPETVGVTSLFQDNRDGTLYAGTAEDGIFCSRDAGATWEAASTGLRDMHIYFLFQGIWDGTLYAGTVYDGAYISRDGGDTWEAASSEPGVLYPLTLLKDSRDGTLYAGTIIGVYRSRDGGSTWESASAGLTDIEVGPVVQDSRDNTLYVGSCGGVYKSQDDGYSWQVTSGGLTRACVWALLMDRENGVLYAGTDSGILRSRDGGDTWEVADTGLPERAEVSSLLQDNRDGTLYAGTHGDGIFRSRNAGDTWEAASAGLKSDFIDILFQDAWDDTLYAKTSYGYFRSIDYGETWKRLPDAYEYRLLPDWLISKEMHFPLKTFGGYQIYNQPSEAVKTVKYYYSWYATIMEVQVEPHTPPRRDLFWALRSWTKFWLIPRAGYFASGVAFIFVIWGLITWGSAFSELRRNPLRSSKIQEAIQVFYADKPAHPILRKWNSLIYSELVAVGDILPEDLTDIPVLLRRQVLDAFYANYQEVLYIQRRGRRLVLLASKPLKNWQMAWQRVSDDLDRHQVLSPKGQKQVCLLAQSLSDGLGFTLEESHLSNSICAWRVDAPALRLNLPARFPLVFVADPNPTPETVRQLVDTVSILKDTNNFALVVALESSRPDVDIPSVLRRLIDASPYAHDFIILTQQDVVDILIARHPERVLVQHISRQVDLSFISPFIINGPVPPQMFFGRERDIRTLVDHAGKRNYAIVGNRKIGKTSLLNQIESRINHQGGIRLLRMDCQAVREAADFYTKLQQLPGMQTDISSPAALAAALRALRTQSDQPLVFILDEVDDLLKAEKDRDESVLSVMRELANEQTCWFIFCGSKILIRQLRDSNSALFNFPETLALTYLSREEMDEVITRPLETLGIHMDDVSAVLDAAWALTSGHPNLTQFVGRVLVNASNENQNRSIGQADVENLWTDAAFVQFYFDTIWGAASPLERLITLLMPPEPFGSSDVEKVFHAVGASVTSIQIDAGLETLVAYSVLKRVGRLHTFVPMAFHRLLDLNYEKERLIAREVEKVNGGME